MKGTKASVREIMSNFPRSIETVATTLIEENLKEPEH